MWYFITQVSYVLNVYNLFMLTNKILCLHKKIYDLNKLKKINGIYLKNFTKFNYYNNFLALFLVLKISKKTHFCSSFYSDRNSIVHL